MIRASFASALPALALSGHASPVSGSIRRIAPSRLRRVAARAQVLRTQGPALVRRVPAWVRAVVGEAELAVVRLVEVGAVAARHIERAFGSEGERTDRVARVLLAPVGDQVPGPGHRQVGQIDREAIETTGDHATIGIAAGTAGTDGWARVVHGRVRPGGIAAAAEDVVVGVERVQIRAAGRELRVDREAEQAAIPVVVDGGGQVGDGRRRRIGQAVELLDASVLLGDEHHAAVGREHDGRRIAQAAPQQPILETGRHGRRRVRGGDRGRGEREQDAQEGQRRESARAAASG